MSEAFRITSAEHPFETRTARGRIMLRRKEHENQLIAGSCADWPDYKLRMGKIIGLSEALDILEQMEQER